MHAASAATAPPSCAGRMSVRAAVRRASRGWASRCVERLERHACGRPHAPRRLTLPMRRRLLPPRRPPPAAACRAHDRVAWLHTAAATAASEAASTPASSSSSSGDAEPVAAYVHLPFCKVCGKRLSLLAVAACRSPLAAHCQTTPSSSLLSHLIHSSAAAQVLLLRLPRHRCRHAGRGGQRALAGACCRPSCGPARGCLHACKGRSGWRRRSRQLLIRCCLPCQS